ncbi:DUF47 domain-containing protein [Ectobacillus sp. sgz5001026]|uniref:DUF47 domain-containing protein n=1 Tax=Ectobacillus sp. sgz5001026 TaxID=3242473 RepID=UPI0036D21599
MSFLNRKDKCFTLLSSISENVKESAKFFMEYKLDTPSEVRRIAKRMKEYEAKGDTFIHELILELNKVFITPIEREDILQLAMSMDDILDNLELCAAQFEIFELTRANQNMNRLNSTIYACTCEMDAALKRIQSMKFLEIRTNAIKMKDYESTCTDILREALHSLFSHEKNPITLMKYKEIYETWNKLAKSCQHVANVLEFIVMKNA